jgi:phosphoglycolate phosphatase
MSLVVFDLDGTLVDSSRDLAESTNELLASYGAAELPFEVAISFVGEGAKVLVERAIARAGLDVLVSEALDRFRAIYDRRLLNYTRPYDGMMDVVRFAAGLAPLAVLTNKPTAPTERILAALGLAPHFRWVLGGDAAFPRKPDPGALRYLMAQARATPAQTIFVGDSMVDIRTARSADVRVCIARYGFGHFRGEDGLDTADWSVDRPAELSAILRKALVSTT